MADPSTESSRCNSGSRPNHGGHGGYATVRRWQAHRVPMPVSPRKKARVVRLRGRAPSRGLWENSSGACTVGSSRSCPGHPPHGPPSGPHHSEREVRCRAHGGSAYPGKNVW